jgi:FlaA1/EpsC-like NDP-sugar epimerase
VNEQRVKTTSRAAQVHKRISDHRRGIAFLIYGGMVLAAYQAAYLLRFEFAVPELYRKVFLVTALPVLGVRLVAFHLFRLTRERWRYASVRDVVRLVTSTVLGTIVLAALDLVSNRGARVPLSILIIEPILTISMIAGVWLSYRMMFELQKRLGSKTSIKRVLVIGAGEAGNLLVREMVRFPTGYYPVAFVDDNPSMWGASIHGVEVAGSSRDLRKFVGEYEPDELIIAIPSAPPAALREIVNSCEETELPFKVLPGIAAVFAGKVAVNQLREVRIEDLLGREPVALHLPELAADLADRIVLVTGAAGSIGSELVRQIALHLPRKLVILDQAETPLFYLDLDLRDAFPDLDIVPVVADIADATAIEDVFRRHAPDRVFHAAAYKHVPMMESNPREAIRNNVIGTWRVAEAAGRFKAERFVLVSTDKAVRPANIMGATKRLAEIITLELQDQYPATAYGAVRFGNVLGSAGSVIPVFKRQIERGQPLTITHPEMTRFFMTIPEAAQLILQSSLLTDFRGHIVMLEMGEPVKILDLAVNLLRLSGHTGDTAERIAFVGMRPGEKMHEELVAPEEEQIPTSYSKIMVLSTVRFRSFNVTSRIAEWRRVIETRSAGKLVEEIEALFPLIARGRNAHPADSMPSKQAS